MRVLENALFPTLHACELGIVIQQNIRSVRSCLARCRLSVTAEASNLNMFENRYFFYAFGLHFSFCVSALSGLGGTLLRSNQLWHMPTSGATSYDTCQQVVAAFAVLSYGQGSAQMTPLSEPSRCLVQHYVVEALCSASRECTCGYMQCVCIVVT